MDSEYLFNAKSALAEGRADQSYLFMAKHNLANENFVEGVAFALASLREALKTKSDLMLFPNKDNLFPDILDCVLTGVTKSEEPLSVLHVWNSIPDQEEIDLEFKLSFSQYFLTNYLDENKFSLSELSEVNRVAFNEILDIFIPW